jgi:H2-forming N5,N10-methylenetetrahydromethanopterin dehydrogenase-like enzyme
MPMFATMNERGAGDGHDIVLVAPASEIAKNEKARNVFNDVVASLNRNGFAQVSDNLANYVRHADKHAKPIQKHESADGTDNDDSE